jgi:hypothetical protein
MYKLRMSSGEVVWDIAGEFGVVGGEMLRMVVEQL